MKRIFLLFIVLSSIFVIAELCSLELESEYQSYYDNTSFLNNYLFTKNLPSSFNLSHTGSIAQYRNKRFNRYSRNADLTWKLLNEQLFLIRSLHLDFISEVDKAQPDLDRYEIRKTRKKVGLDFEYSPADSVTIQSDWTYIFSDEYNSAHSNEHLKNEGYQNLNKFHIFRENNALALDLNSHYDILSLDYDYAKDYGMNINFRLFNPDLAAKILIQRNANKIYLLHDNIDDYSRSSYQLDTKLNHPFSDNFTVSIGDQFKLRDNKLRIKRERNFIETENHTFLNTKTELARFKLLLGGEFLYTSRLSNLEINSRTQEQRVFNGALGYYFSERDSLVYKRRLALERTDYTHNENTLDNDLLVDENLASLYTYLRNTILLTSHFNYTRRDDIYLRTQMSGNNKTNRSYTLSPALNIELTPNLQVTQDYVLRADYDDFHWSELAKNRMYRKFSANYSVFIKFPNSRLDQQLVLEHDQLIEENDTLLGLSLIYDTNSSGTLQGSAYQIMTENEYYTWQFEIFRRIERLEILFKPRFIWSTTIDNTKKFEFNHLFDIVYYRPDRYSNLHLNLNPAGTSIKNFIWRINAIVTFVI